MPEEKNRFLNESILSAVWITNLPSRKKATMYRNGGSEIIEISKRNDNLEEKTCQQSHAGLDLVIMF